jgi:hypothetical protein
MGLGFAAGAMLWVAWIELFVEVRASMRVHAQGVPSAPLDTTPIHSPSTVGCSPCSHKTRKELVVMYGSRSLHLVARRAGRDHVAA